MGFYDVYKQYADFDFERFLNSIDANTVHTTIQKERLSPLDFLVLLSPEADRCLEMMAQKANRLTVQHFGKVIFLYTPMYLANYCVNRCTYCGFNATNKIERRKLGFSEVEREAEAIASTGLRHILVLTGESREKSPVSYIRECIRILFRYFRSVSVEIYPLDMDEYEILAGEGVDGLTIYQEVYNEQVYYRVHPAGPKRDYRYRLDTPERACIAGIRNVNTGALLGLDDWVKEAFFAGIHADYLQEKYPGTEISISLPRLRPHVGSFKVEHPVSDRELVRIMTAMRLFMPRVGITISTREAASLRDNLVGLGVTKMSAGSSTEVGGHAAEDKGTPQFDISDNRSVEQIREMIYEKGYQPVFKDWQRISQ